MSWPTQIGRDQRGEVSRGRREQMDCRPRRLSHERSIHKGSACEFLPSGSTSAAHARKTTFDICHGPRKCHVVVLRPRKHLRLAGSRTAGFTVHLCLFFGAPSKATQRTVPGRGPLQGTAWLPPSNTTTHRPHTLEGRGHRGAWQWLPHPLPGHTQRASVKAPVPSLQPAGLAAVPCFGPRRRLQFCHLRAFAGTLRAD